ncbi:carbohydrate esterase family 1 protein [Melanomma pulvis-pyrius CBS 109.77]|uniref:Carboxylic ester hydrolase n=1 Tax=Melanomma pulvis-pyrius CBS 109.77 TaxID=1314802 RepID=A0A6A6XBL1_9PLEO|nr:carbohydrate esterase family 1 protein [Melanomma pulvis-pyrius CBS 109.77]
MRSVLALLASYLAVVSTSTTSLSKRAVSPGTLSQVTSFGNAPTKAAFYIYVPKALVAAPGVVVAIHYCTGSAQLYYDGSPYKTLSEQYGFIVIYPSSPHSGTCWDVSSKATLKHEGGGDSNTIANMVKWTINEYKADTTKVFVTGSSSGAMMTNVLAATYPDLFLAGIAYSGVPAGCFVSASDGVDAWNGTCANGQSSATPAEWAQVVFDMYPNYNGTRPKMQIYHGSSDTALLPNNYNETMKQWAGVWGYSYDEPDATKSNDPQSGYTRTTYGPMVEGIYAQGVGHTVPIRGADDMKYFGFA